jgi:hypothetical protein
LEQIRKKKEAEDKLKREQEITLAFGKWVLDNINRGIIGQDECKNFQTFAETFLEGLVDLAEGAAEAAERLARGKSYSSSFSSGAAVGAISLGASIFYAWAEGALEGAVTRIAKEYVLNKILKGVILCGNSNYGIIKSKGTTSYFYFKRGNEYLVFCISSSDGLYLLGSFNSRD